MSGTMAPTIGAMVYELAAGLHPGRDVLARYGVNIPEFRQLIADPNFQAMLKNAKAEFASLASTPDRVRLKAQLITEVGLEEMWEIIRTEGVPPAARVSAFNAIKALTGMDSPEEAKPLQKFSLKIILPSPASPSFAGPVITINSGDPEVQALASAPTDPTILEKELTGASVG